MQTLQSYSDYSSNSLRSFAKQKLSKVSHQSILYKSSVFIWRIIQNVLLIYNYYYDYNRLIKWSSATSGFNTKSKLHASITKNYHSIEKGLALRQPKVGFGKDTIKRLVSNLEELQNKYGIDTIGQIALNTLSAYYQFNLEHGLVDEDLFQKITKLKNYIHDSQNTTNQGGILEISRKTIVEAAQMDLQAFFKSRHSIRQFDSEDVDMSLIEKAVTMAQKTPSVCNRQSCKVYVFSSYEDKIKVLSYQNGNRGFGDQANKILIVVSDLENFTSIGERNQCWIDGGMYAMSLVYALHSLGLGTCCLNWSVEYKVDQALKQTTGIKDSESIIMMIAVGHIPEKLNVAQSARKKVDEVLVMK
ncbi:nitroreductase family protein [Anabaena sp. 4-3]|uniref:nitroreductase family protein n=1 Tax=Anabaena sp. 4-3 TaxID=1811979 RepID=UPI0009EF54D2|nr:nitroreductase family protein [Anabaena sp. 4-3]